MPALEAPRLPLAGLHVLNTRPVGRSHPLDQALTAAGALISSLPLLETIPSDMSPADRRKLMDLDRYRAVFVVSPTAAELGLDALQEYWPQWPVGQAWIAVGHATARVLERSGLAPWVPALETSEGVTTLPPLAALQAGDRVLVLRGEGGRNLVRDWLQSRAVLVDYLDLYQRRLPEEAAGQWSRIVAVGEPDVVVLTSGESLRHWLAVAGESARRIPALLISDRLADQARTAGILTILTAAGTQPGQILLTLQAWRKEAGRGID